MHYYFNRNKWKDQLAQITKEITDKIQPNIKQTSLSSQSQANCLFDIASSANLKIFSLVFASFKEILKNV